MKLAPRYSHQTPAFIEMVLKEAFSLFLYDTILLTILPLVINLWGRWGNICKELLDCVILCYYFGNKCSLVINTCVPHFTAYPWFWCIISETVNGQLMTMEAQVVRMRLLVSEVVPRQVFLQIPWFFHGSCLDINAPTSLSARTHNRLINRNTTKIIQSHLTPTSTYLPFL
jgi:hypothetical protein